MARRQTALELMTNNQERWNDQLSDLSAGKGVGANAPTWSAFRSGINAYAFSASAMNEVWINIHITHDYKAGTKVYPHIHWSTTGTNTGVVRWGIEYTIAKGHGQQAWPVTTTVYLEQAFSGTAYTHMITETSEANALPGDDLEPDTLVLMRVFRDAAHGNDTQTSTAFGFYADVHYQSDGNLTTTKAPTWVKNTDEHGTITFDRLNELMEVLQ